jgi:hypothetical protein
MKFRILVILLFISTAIFAQTKIGGKVMDEFNEPIAFANVIFKNSKEGIITDENGKFYFESKENYDTVVISFIGYEPVEISLNKGLNLKINAILKEGVA